jgi:hypothetical protein
MSAPVSATIKSIVRRSKPGLNHRAHCRVRTMETTDVSLIRASSRTFSRRWSSVAGRRSGSCDTASVQAAHGSAEAARSSDRGGPRSMPTYQSLPSPWRSPAFEITTRGHPRSDQPHDRVRVAGRLDRDLVGRQQAVGERPERLRTGRDLPSLTHLPPSVERWPGEQAGKTTTTDSRSKRTRASRRGRAKY